MPARVVPSGELFLQPAAGQKPEPLQLFVWTPADNEFHFYCHGLTLADFAAVFGKEVAPARGLLMSYDPAMLAPAHWETYSRDADDLIRQQFATSITRTHEGQRQIWRADRAGARILAQEAPGVRLVRGCALSAPASFILQNARGPRLEWAASDAELDPGRAQADLNAFRLNGESLLYSADGPAVRVAFRSRQQFRRALNAAVRGWLLSMCDDHVAQISHRVLDMLARAADGFGLYAATEDFVDKGRSFEISCHLGKTVWGARDPEALDALGDETRILIYYDRVSGIWEIVS